LVGAGSCTAPEIQVPPPSEQVPEILTGRWQLTTKNESIRSSSDTLIFATDRSLIAISNGRAKKGRYWIKPDHIPMHIDLVGADPQDWFQGAFAIPDRKTLLLQRRMVGVGDPVRPIRVQANMALTYRKVSNATELPEEVNVVQEQLPSLELRERSARGYLLAVMFAQRYYFDRAGAYATRLSQIDPGLYEEDIDYRYQVITRAPTLIWITATPKYPELSSFTAQVASGNLYSCGSLQPTTQPPSIVIDPVNGPFSCDAGSVPFTN